MAVLTCCCHPRELSPTDQRMWNKIIKHEVLEGNPELAILAYSKMVEAGYHGDNFTFPMLLKAASHLSSSSIGTMLHAQTLKTGFWSHTFVQTSLLNFYSSLGHVGSASKVFKDMSERDLVAWNSMLDAYASAGQMDVAVSFLDSLPYKDCTSVNIMISGYANIGNVNSARRMFDEIHTGDAISWNSIILAYTRAGEMGKARKLFDKMPGKNVVSWNTMICGYLESGLYDDALNLFNEMRDRRIEPNNITLTSALSVCARLGSLEIGRTTHIYGAEIGLTSDPHVRTSLIDMYAKCGSIKNALVVFYQSKVKDIYSWNSMISGLALHGNGRMALKLFEDMARRGMKPDDLTFIALLTACSHTGMLEDGCHLFESMEITFGVLPKLEHYGCMVDLLGRAGFLSSAYRVIKTMPYEPGASVWGAMLSACVVHRDLEIGEIVANHMVERVDNLTDGEYMMLANLYASHGRWDDADRWRGMMNSKGISKAAGCSMIEVNGRIHTFLAGNTSYEVDSFVYKWDGILQLPEVDFHLI